MGSSWYLTYPSFSRSYLTSRVVDLNGVLPDTHGTVFNRMPHPMLLRNVHEHNIFTTYLGQRDISINDLFNDIVELKRASIADQDENEAEEKWGAGKKLCPFCVVKVVREKLFDWWRIERAKGHLDGACSLMHGYSR